MMRLVIVGAVFVLLTLGNAALLYHDHNEYIAAGAALTGPPTPEGEAALQDIVGDDYNHPKIGIIPWFAWRVAWFLGREALLVVVAGTTIMMKGRGGRP
jgi:hypothetical protein